MAKYFLIGLTLILLTGCGTKGPLYIPEQRYPQAAEKAPATPPATEPNKE